MKFTQTTNSVLKNFSTINPSVALHKGNVVRTISPHKSVVAEAVLDQDLEGDACIYDLNRFISTLSLFEDPDICFSENKFVIKSGHSRVNYTYASESMILTPPDRDMTMPSREVSTVIKWNDFEKVVRAASVLKLPDIVVLGTKSGISLAAMDVNNPSADQFDLLVDETPHDNFKYVYRTENLKLLPSDYKVEISSKGVSKFTGDVVTYYVAVETTSET